MGDAGANLLGYLLGLTAVVGSLKTGALVALVVPLMILAIPFLDTGFVVAKRVKYRRKPWSADDYHFHHRMAKIGFSQRKTVAYLYAWSLLMAGFAVALRLISHHELRPQRLIRHHHIVVIHHRVVYEPYPVGWLLPLIAYGIVCLLASIYLVYVLEILKFKRLRAGDIRQSDPDTTEHEIDAQVSKDIETGEFERVP
jgi:UDP-GlcNAc:undecaprenyl-phosphate GlcNAc-1-phosphate transferase